MFGRFSNILHLYGHLMGLLWVVWAIGLNKIESCQFCFTKHIKSLSGMWYSERLACLGLESLHVRRLQCDLRMCYKVIHYQITTHNDNFFVFSDCTTTRGHCCKLFKSYSRVNIHKYFSSNCIQARGKWGGKGAIAPYW